VCYRIKFLRRSDPEIPSLMGVTHQQLQKSHRRNKNSRHLFPFPKWIEHYASVKINASGRDWLAKIKKYAIRNAVAVQYCSLLENIGTACASPLLALPA
jgi:hypothetical protein